MPIIRRSLLQLYASYSQAQQTRVLAGVVGEERSLRGRPQAARLRRRLRTKGDPSGRRCPDTGGEHGRGLVRAARSCRPASCTDSTTARSASICAIRCRAEVPPHDRARHRPDPQCLPPAARKERSGMREGYRFLDQRNGSSWPPRSSPSSSLRVRRWPAFLKTTTARQPGTPKVPSRVTDWRGWRSTRRRRRSKRFGSSTRDGSSASRCSTWSIPSPAAASPAVALGNRDQSGGRVLPQSLRRP